MLRFPNVDDVCNKYLSGCSIKDVALHYGISEGTVRKRLRIGRINLRPSVNVQTGRHGHRIDLDGRELEIIEKYQSGISSTRLGYEYNTNHGVICRILKRYKIPIRRTAAMAHARVDSYRDEIINLYVSGISITRIGKTLNLAYNSVNRILLESGVEKRKPGMYPLSNSVNWRGGNKTPLELYGLTANEWRNEAKEIRNRDGHICQKCGHKGSGLNVHHIIPARYFKADNKNNPENLITLCRNCHISVESHWWDYVEVFQMYLGKYFGYNDFIGGWSEYLPKKLLSRGLE